MHSGTSVANCVPRSISNENCIPAAHGNLAKVTTICNSSRYVRPARLLQTVHNILQCQSVAKWETESLLGKIGKCGRVGRDLLEHHKCAGEWDL